MIKWQAICLARSSAWSCVTCTAGAPTRGTLNTKIPSRISATRRSMSARLTRLPSTRATGDTCQWPRSPHGSAAALPVYSRGCGRVPRLRRSRGRCGPRSNHGHLARGRRRLRCDRGSWCYLGGEDLLYVCGVFANERTDYAPADIFRNVAGVHDCLGSGRVGDEHAHVATSIYRPRETRHGICVVRAHLVKRQYGLPHVNAHGLPTFPPSFHSERRRSAARSSAS